MGHTTTMKIKALVFLYTIVGAHAFTVPRVLSKRPSTTQLQAASKARTTTAESNTRQVWREVANPKEGGHLDFMVRRYPVGDAVQTPRDNLHSHYVYFVRLNSKFVFCFQGISQVHQCRAYFSKKIHPSTRNARWGTERGHDSGPWYCRLPKGITETKRKKILQGLDKLIAMYGDDYDFVYNQRRNGHQGFEDTTVWIKENKKRREEFRQQITALLEEEEECDTTLADLVWIAVAKEEDCLQPQPKSSQSAIKVLRQEIVSLKKALNKISPPPKKEKGEEVRLSKFRRKHLEKQQAKDRTSLDEVGTTIRALSEALEDAISSMIEYRNTHKGSSSKQFQALLEALQEHKKLVNGVSRVHSDYYWRFEMASHGF